MSPAPFRLPEPRSGQVDLLVVAGEHSGDEHAAKMVAGALAGNPSLRIAAIGGPKLAAAGAQLLHDLTADSVVGLVEVLKNLPFFRRFFEAVLAWVSEHRPRAVCFVDYPGLNLRLAGEMRRRGLSRQGFGPIRILYYISPQIWAWKASRRFTMARDIDAMAVIFPFEVGCYGDTHLVPEFVGHPFVEPDYHPPVSYAADGPVLLLPGSRRQAVKRIFPALLEGFARFRKHHPGAKAVVLYPSDTVREVLQSHALPEGVALVKTGAAVAASAVLTSSGTMSMHCALAAIPGAIVYRANELTYWIGRFLVRIDYLGIANLLLDEPVYPEYLQAAARPQALASELEACVHEPSRREKIRDAARRLRSILGHPQNGDASAWLLRQLAL